MSFRRLKDVGFANLEDSLHSCLKDISYSGMKDMPQRQFLDILARWFYLEKRHLESIFARCLLDSLKMLDLKI